MVELSINNGVLEKYFGDVSELIIPEEVNEIADHWLGVFHSHKELTKVILPQGLHRIGENAFSDCSGLTNISIPNSVTDIGSLAFSGCSGLTDITIPDSVTSIEGYAFSNCNSLMKITIKGMTEVNNYAFGNCTNLSKIDINNKKCKIKTYAFAVDYNESEKGHLSDKLVSQIEVLYPFWDDNGIKNLILCEEIWTQLSPELQAKIYLNRQSKVLKSRYPLLIRSSNDAELIGDAIRTILSDNPSSKVYDSAATFISDYYAIISRKLTENLFATLKSSKDGAKTAEKLADNEEFMNYINSTSDSQSALSLIEKKFLQILNDQNLSINVPAANLKQYYGIESDVLPPVEDAEGNMISPILESWLLTVHEEWSNGALEEVYREPGVSPIAQEIVDMLDIESFHQALMKLAEDNLGEKGKRIGLAYPVCRYADEKMMETLTKRASQWKSKTSGNDAPALLNFRKASLYSNTKAALLFADKYDKEWMHDLDRYAEIRGVDTDALRDQIITDTGLDSERSKTYDLGNQIVKIRLQKDLTFTIELPDGKTVKTLPKKNVDLDKYSAANEDFTSLKKNIKKIIKNRINNLFDDFLSGKAREGKSWQGSYLENPLLRDIASLLVWEQDGETFKTFTLTESGPIDSSGSPYMISDKDIRLAYPAEMDRKDLAVWQKYFTSQNLKQPFLQLWEPVRNLSEITPDRYKGCSIPYYRLINQEKHGITVQTSYDGDFYECFFYGCSGNIQRVDGYGHIDAKDLFEVIDFLPNKSGYNSRYANHIVAYLDRITIWERIQKDDTSILDLLPQFTAAQINEFISIATDIHAVNVTALLMEYKNTHYPDLDPLAEFTLDLI